MEIFDSFLKSVKNPLAEGRKSLVNINGSTVTTYRELQKIGITKDHTDRFKRFREEFRKREEQKTRDSLQFLEMLMKGPAVQTSTSSPLSFLSSFIGSKETNKINNPHCLFCGKSWGLFDKKIQCKLCEYQFCNKCINKLTSNDVTGVLKDKEELLVCERCKIVVTRQETQRKLEDKLSQSRSKMEPIRKAYEDLMNLRDKIVRSYANYEYLAVSITDGSIKSRAQNAGSIYENANNLEQDLQRDFHAYELTLKKFISIPVTKDSKLEKLKQNIQRDMVSFLQDYLPKFRKMEKNVVVIEKSTLNNLYIILRRLAIENMRNPIFWNRFNGLFIQLTKIVQQDLMNAVLQAGDNWNEHKSYLEEMVSQWEKHYPPLLGNTVTEFEGTLIRKNISALNDAMKKLKAKLGSDDIPSRQALEALIKRLENAYYDNANSFLTDPSSESSPLTVRSSIDESFQEYLENYNTKEHDEYIR